MIDISIYRQNESLAKNDLRKWQIRARHSLDVFEKAGFPIKVDNILQLRALIDTMSESRFDKFMAAMGGFDEVDLNLFVNAAVLSIRFNEFLFSNKQPILALDNLMQAMLFYVLINKLKKFGSVLELGCGSGFVSFFMAQKNDLELYAQTEVCESFYILQSLISSFLFSGRFYEGALPHGIELDHWTSDSQSVAELNFLPKPPLAAHYPWWRLGELASSEQKFDIIASNANLLEFSRAALLDYLPLIQKKLKDDGLFVFHCEGMPANGTFETLLSDLYAGSFAPLYITSEYIIDGNLDFEQKKIVLVPAGYAATYILKNEDFTSKFEEIVLLDDAKAGGELLGYKIVSKEELRGLGISEGVIYHDKNGVVKYFESVFSELGIKKTNIKLKDIGRSFAVFVGDKHPLFEKYYDKNNYKRYFDSGEDMVDGLFDFSTKQGKLYAKNDIFEIIKMSILNDK